MKEAKKWDNSKQEVTNVSDESINQINKGIKKLQDEEERYVKAYGAEAISLEQLKEHTAIVKEKIVSLKQQVAYLEQQKRQPKSIEIPPMEILRGLCKNAKKMLNYMNFEAKQETIRELIEKITGDQKKMVIEGYLPLKPNYYVEYKTIDRNCGVAECG